MASRVSARNERLRLVTRFLSTIFRARSMALALTIAAVVVPTALAGSDIDFERVIAEKTTQFNREIAAKAAEMASKGEVPKTGPLTSSSPSCAAQAPVQPFLRWNDFADYTLLPGGTFESGTPGWTLENNARVVTTPTTDLGGGTRALSIPKGSKVITRPVCVTELHPTIRFFAQAKGSTSTRLLVEVFYEDLGGSVNTMPIAYLKPSTTWQPTTIIPIHVNLRAAVSPTKTAAVAFRLSAEEGDGTWLVDGLYVDPYKVK